MIFFVMLVACSFLINDAVQLDTDKPYYENFDLSRSEKKSRSNHCELRCPCPRGPSELPEVYSIGNNQPPRSQRNYVEWSKKASEDASPLGMEAVYSVWQQDDLNYPLLGPVYRKPFV